MLKPFTISIAEKDTNDIYNYIYLEYNEKLYKFQVQFNKVDIFKIGRAHV